MQKQYLFFSFLSVAIKYRNFHETILLLPKVSKRLIARYRKLTFHKTSDLLEEIYFMVGSGVLFEVVPVLFGSLIVRKKAFLKINLDHLK
jgi:hypothetical protein